MRKFKQDAKQTQSTVMREDAIRGDVLSAVWYQESPEPKKKWF